MGRIRPVGVAAVVVLLALWPVLAPAPSAAAPTTAAVATRLIPLADPAIEGLRYESHSTFVLDPPARMVHVRIDMTVTNEQPNQYRGGFVREFYFPVLVVPIATEASNIGATRDDGTSLSVSTEPTRLPALSIATVTLRPALFYNQTQSITLTYDLPGQPPRSDSTTRINDAVGAFLMFVLGDPGITSAKVIVPGDLEVDIAGVDMKQETLPDGTAQYSDDSIDDPLHWGGAVLATNDDKLLRSDPKLADHEIEVRAWPDDQPWLDFVNQHIQRGVPALERLIGLPWPDAPSPLQVTETISPYVYGASGWYISSENKIDIGDELEPIVILHELAHVWFNRTLFDKRWINEGLAEEYASRVLTELGNPAVNPEPIDRAAPGAFQLNEWGAPRIQSEDEIARERYGYNASWSLMRSLIGEVGLDKMTLVYDAAARNRIAYVGDGEPEEAAGVSTDWRYFLDLVQERTSSTAIESTMNTYVVNDKERAMLADRATARTKYAALRDAGRGWSPPLPVRQEMAFWTFANANKLMDEATAVLRKRDDIAAKVEGLGVSVPGALERSYETEKLDRSSARADELLHAAGELAAASQAVHESHGIIGAIGLLGGAADDALSSAKERFEQGDAAATVEKANDAHDLADDATREGLFRIASAGLLVGVLLSARRWGKLRAVDPSMRPMY